MSKHQPVLVEGVVSFRRTINSGTAEELDEALLEMEQNLNLWVFTSSKGIRLMPRFHLSMKE